MARSNGHVSVLVEDPEATIIGESDGTGTSDEESSDTESGVEDRYYLNESMIMDDDVVPTYILQPREISKNIDLMRTVAILLEGKLKQPQVKIPDIEKIRELYSDIHRFPEAFQKFTSIVHQIQYLNVTPDWENNTELQSSSLALDEDYENIFTKVLNTAFSRTGSCPSLDFRKRIMLNLLYNVQKVFARYQTIQTILEDRLKKYNKTITKKYNLDRNANDRTSETTVLDSLEDDAQTPLLSSRRNSQSRQRRSCDNLMKKFELMGEILRKTRRSATDVQDSIDVLRDLIRWDYKQAASTASLSSGSGNYGTTSRHGSFRNPSQSSKFEPNNDQTEEVSSRHSETVCLLPDVESHQTDCLTSNPQITNCIPSARGKKYRKIFIFLVIVISLVLILSIITVALSFLKFSY